MIDQIPMFQETSGNSEAKTHRAGWNPQRVRAVVKQHTAADRPVNAPLPLMDGSLSMNSGNRRLSRYLDALDGSPASHSEAA